MRKALVVAALLALGSVPALAQDMHAGHAEHASFSILEQDWAKQKLDKSPRHQEWAEIKYGTRTVRCFVVYPEVKGKATAVIVIHEIFGLSDWVRGVADQLAEAGYIAIAPDLLSGMGADGGGSSSFTDRGSVTQAVQKLPPDQVTADLNAVADYVAKLPAANGKVAVGGFCWGGTQSFRFATNRPTLKAAFVFYGTGPDKDSIARIKAPVYGFYGGSDARVTATVPASTGLMKDAAKSYDPVTYEGAGHGFMRSGEDPTATDANKDANKKAHDEAWERWKSILKKL